MNPTQSWEYLIEIVPKANLSKERLNQLGLMRWELCAAVATCEPPSSCDTLYPGMVKYYFKRAIPQ